MNAKKKIGISVILFLLGAMALFASLSDNIRVEIIDNLIVVTNYNDVLVTVTLSIEYIDGNFTRFAPVDFPLGRNGFSDSIKQWKAPRGTQIIGFNIRSVNSR